MMKWKINNKTRKYDGHFKVEQLAIQHELFAGGMSKELMRERVTRQNAIGVLPYDPVRDEVVLVEQFRVGALEGRDNPWLIEVIAGLVEEGEEYEDVVIREAKEEANCEIKNLRHISSFFPSPGGFSETFHIYIAQTDTTNLGGICGLDEEGEDIQVHVVSSSKAIEMLHEGKISTAISMVTMYNFIALRDELINAWTAG